MARAARLFASWFGAGYLPVAPGTWGSLGALPLAYLLVAIGGAAALALGAALVFALGLWAAGDILRRGRLKDPADVVIDEVAGQMIAVLPVASVPLLWPVAFLLFRAADIAKPWPVSWAERRLPGALGVMADDAVAGLYAAAGTSAVAWLVGGA